MRYVGITCSVALWVPLLFSGVFASGVEETTFYALGCT